jgi:predicted kinase
MPPVVYLLCGLTGSGKTTYARRLEAAGAVRLSVVEELPRRLVELVESGHDVVLDYGLWRRSDRDAYKRLVEAHGGRCERVDGPRWKRSLAAWSCSEAQLS